MSIRIKLLLPFLVPALSFAQNREADTLRHALATAKTDSVRFMIIDQMIDHFKQNNPDSAISYMNRSALIARKNDELLDEAGAYTTIGYYSLDKSEYPKALIYLQRAIRLEEDPDNENKSWNPNKIKPGKSIRLSYLGYSNLAMGRLMGDVGNDKEQISLYKKVDKLAKKTDDKILLGLININLGKVYMRLNKLDSALIFEQKAAYYAKQVDFKRYAGTINNYTAMVYLKKGMYALALQHYHMALNEAIAQNDIQQMATEYSSLSVYYVETKNADSAIYYGRKNLEALIAIQSKDLDKPYEELYKGYQLHGQIDSAYKYQGLTLSAKEKILIYNASSAAEFHRLSFNDQLRTQQLQKGKTDFKTRIRIWMLLATIAILMLLAIIFYRNNRQKQKANIVLNRQKKEVADALSQLKSTQMQLIQREKMASLGELIAGIAHEIQNPLNFVNNFSEVSIELLQELKEEEQAGNKEDVIALANDLAQNLQKINHHGSRADSIVKGMLEHSRIGMGEKELTDINNLADEFLKLSYHGLRAKDKSFNAELITKFNEHLPKLNVTPQDLGRVLLNLFNNAFYAVKEKKKLASADYKPEVTVVTAVENNQLLIIVKDNGNGIPQNIRDKIMQPFFTTKPTGEGTGLGLSLSYDIVVKGHGGNIVVNTQENGFTKFTISLPMNK